VGGEHLAGDPLGLGGHSGMVVGTGQGAARDDQRERQREGDAEGDNSSHGTLLAARWGKRRKGGAAGVGIALESACRDSSHKKSAVSTVRHRQKPRIVGLFLSTSRHRRGKPL